MKHEIHYNEKDKVAEIKYVGDISVNDVDKITEHLKKILEGKTERSIVADIAESPLLQIDRDARMKMAEIAKTLNLERIAIIGASPMNRMMGKIVLALFGKSKDSMFFKTREDALVWLKEG